MTDYLAAFIGLALPCFAAIGIGLWSTRNDGKE